MKTSEGATPLSRNSLGSTHKSNNQLTPVQEKVMKERVERVGRFLKGKVCHSNNLFPFLNLNSKVHLCPNLYLT